jgi:hydrogenase/urease accessory protein HupE
MNRRRRAQTTVEYMLTVSVITIAIMAVVYTLMSVVYEETGSLGRSLGTSLTTDGVQ